MEIFRNSIETPSGSALVAPGASPERPKEAKMRPKHARNSHSLLKILSKAPRAKTVTSNRRFGGESAAGLSLIKPSVPLT